MKKDCFIHLSCALFLIVENARIGLEKHNVFANIEEKLINMSKLVPLYPELITLGENMRFGYHVHLIVHDVCYMMLNNRPDFQGIKFKGK